MKKYIPFLMLLAAIAGCKNNNHAFDASGTFEADEMVVASEMGGKILSLNIEEGIALAKDSIVGAIDAGNIALQNEQVEASARALGEKTADAAPQVALLQSQLAVQQSQLDNILHEQRRVENLLKEDAATGKQLDDLVAQANVLRRQMEVTRKQITVQQSNVATQNRGILSETRPLAKRSAQLKDMEQRARIVNPVAGTVITQYARTGEITSPGKALYKIADLSTLTLRAYITGSQLPQVKTGMAVKVLVDDGKDKYRTLPGTLTWISDKAEFTPKTIQTKEERANLVYAVKIKVPNDGYLKIGMYAEVNFK